MDESTKTPNDETANESGSLQSTLTGIVMPRSAIYYGRCYLYEKKTGRKIVTPLDMENVND